ncbi:hypothetical protein PC118_g20952 [Phytophthora cactorum]|uniref:Uncharacterized protein n=1 Tax=Phytophthora cactorum TaxID=29920 RepID=A0A8T1F467_9STRA|nr:hypothetical protein PC114_g8318 [Phytophthora cactorum]KAG2963338.1 hypothetical protein PC118_g20952 [Phytophthora cactorum]KAG2973583.1 hypothetical protein PC119_g22883 [Phytophthora cactorum]KAG3158379.1 hypothetical protein PC128_g21523 [Phytophthora cactorum]
MTQLYRHKEVTTRLKSVMYLHVTREYDAAADSLASEALESKTSRVVLSESRKAELGRLNRIPTVLYEEAETKTVSTGSIQCAEVFHIPTRKTFADFVLNEPHMIRHDEDGPQVTPDENSLNKQQTGTIQAQESEPNVEDIDPLTVQEKWIRLIAKAQDEELRW